MATGAVDRKVYFTTVKCHALAPVCSGGISIGSHIQKGRRGHFLEGKDALGLCWENIEKTIK